MLLLRIYFYNSLDPVLNFLRTFIQGERRSSSTFRHWMDRVTFLISQTRGSILQTKRLNKDVSHMEGTKILLFHGTIGHHLSDFLSYKSSGEIRFCSVYSLSGFFRNMRRIGSDGHHTLVLENIGTTSSET